MFRTVLFVLSAVLAQAAPADAKLDALRATLTSMRGAQMQNIGKGAPRGATSQLSTAKHDLRDWIESRLPELGERDNQGAFESRVNSELRAAGLMFDPTHASASDPWSMEYLGYLNPVRVQRSSVFVVVVTSLGIQCGEDESAYVYAWSGDGWQRVLQNEQNDYRESAYKPQFLNDVVISPWNPSNNYVALTLGVQTWCASAWHDVYYRAYRLGGDPLARPLVSGEELAYLGSDQAIRGSVTTDDVLIQYNGPSIDGGILVRPHIRHYRIDGPEAKRIAPLALRPRDFVDEWLTHEWREAAFWSESANRRGMLAWHEKLHKDNVHGEFIYPTMHCPATPDLWQVGVDFSDPPTPIGEPPKGVYFTVRWRPPYEFSMVQVTDTSSEACNREDREADDDPQTLFR
ncbi:MAG TPA: hypothetical protein VMH80_24780 [Bryobacteraceae bacterium]|nr:hypothetical protein [Bryobacteraceae bacterium]